MIAESAFNDPTGTVLTLALASVRHRRLDRPRRSGRATCSKYTLGALIGVGGGLGLAVLLSDTRLGLWRESPAAAILAVVAAEYFASEEIGTSGYLAAFIMGLVVGNMDLCDYAATSSTSPFLKALPARPRKSPCSPYS